MALLNGLSKFAKPEVLPYLLGYVNGTAENLLSLMTTGEEPLETVYFVRKAAVLALGNVAKYYAKEVRIASSLFNLLRRKKVHFENVFGYFEDF